VAVLFGAWYVWREYYSREELLAAAVAGETRRAAVLAALGAKTDARDGNGWTPLHHAVDRGDREMAAALTGAGADPNAFADPDILISVRPPWPSGTPLHLSLTDREMTALLLEAGADLRLPQHCEIVPIAIETPASPEVLQLLVDHGADVNAAYWLDGIGTTPLHMADGKYVQILLRAGAGPNAADDGGRRPLHYAVRSRDETKVALLIDAGADVDAADSLGLTPLDWAEVMCAGESVSLLKPKGAAAGKAPLPGAGGISREGRMVTRVYGFRDLVNAADSPQDLHDLRPMMSFIRKRIMPGAWAEELGASIERRSAMLIVRQYPEVHEVLSKLVNHLRAPDHWPAPEQPLRP
jgi:ankyrin repeat protein